MAKRITKKQPKTMALTRFFKWMLIPTKTYNIYKKITHEKLCPTRIKGFEQ
jgi:hypothetical protein